MAKQMHELKYERHTFILFHYPIAEWNGSYHGAIHLYGHRRNHVIVSYKSHDNGLLRYDVGVDVNAMAPASIQEIIASFEQHTSVLGVYSMERFKELSQEKQQCIIDAGMEVFGRYEYRKVNTEDITAKAGISKGLLLYYFKDKKSFYMYLFQYCVTTVTKTLDDEDFIKTTDFFALIELGARKKTQIVVEHPFILGFICRIFSSRREAVSSDVAMELHSLMDTTFDCFFAHVDFSKFNDDVDLKRVYQMLVQMTEGYMYEKFNCQEMLKSEDIMKDLEEWKVIFKKMAYKKEYQ